MKYRIQAIIEASRLPEIVTVLYGGPELKFNPELKISPATKIEVAFPPPRIAAPVEEPKRRRRAPDGRRHQILGDTLKTGPKRWSKLRTALVNGGISEHSLNSLIKAWQTAQKIDRGPDGLWRLVAHEQF